MGDRIQNETGKELLYVLMEAQQTREELMLLQCNAASEAFGLSLTREDIHALMECRKDSLRKYQRVEFGKSILDKLIAAFCDSQFIEEDTWLDTLKELQDVFYQFKNQTQDQMTDDELIHIMKDSFENVCFGDLDYLSGTCLERTARAVRGGYRGYQETDGYGEYEQFSEEARWSRETYVSAFNDLVQ